MGKRGITPKSELTVVRFDSNARPNPPAGMESRARNLFKKIIAENPAGAFYDHEAISLLKAFCEAESDHYTANKKVQEEGQAINSQIGYNKITGETLYKVIINPWFNVKKESAGVMASMSAKLRAKRAADGEDKKPKPGNIRRGLMFGE